MENNARVKERVLHKAKPPALVLKGLVPPILSLHNMSLQTKALSKQPLLQTVRIQSNLKGNPSRVIPPLQRELKN